MSHATAWIAVALHLVERIDVTDADSLSRLVSTADMIDHAIVTADEVASALDDLSSRGWLELDGNECTLTKSAKRIVASAIDEAGSPMAISELRAKLEAHAPFTAPAAPTLSRTAFKK